MADAVCVKVVLLRQRELEENQLAGWQLVELLDESRFKQPFSFGFLRAVNVDFRLENRHETRREDLRRHFELLSDDLFDAAALACG